MSLNRIDVCDYCTICAVDARVFGCTDKVCGRPSHAVDADQTDHAEVTEAHRYERVRDALETILANARDVGGVRHSQFASDVKWTAMKALGVCRCPEHTGFGLSTDTIACGSCGEQRTLRRDGGISECPFCPPGHDPCACVRCRARHQAIADAEKRGAVNERKACIGLLHEFGDGTMVADGRIAAEHIVAVLRARGGQ